MHRACRFMPTALLSLQAILEQPERHAFLLVGSSTAASFGAASLQPYLQRQLISQAASLDQLAADTGMPAEALAAELQAYDQAAVEGRDSFGKTAFPARIHLLQPMYWARVAPVAHYCMGGLAIDRDARVLDAQGRPIPGLFAAGEVAGVAARWLGTPGRGAACMCCCRADKVPAGQLLLWLHSGVRWCRHSHSCSAGLPA